MADQGSAYLLGFIVYLYIYLQLYLFIVLVLLLFTRASIEVTVAWENFLETDRNLERSQALWWAAKAMFGEKQGKRLAEIFMYCSSIKVRTFQAF